MMDLYPRWRDHLKNVHLVFFSGSTLDMKKIESLPFNNQYLLLSLVTIVMLRGVLR